MKFRAWNIKSKEYVSKEFLDQLFIRMDGRVIWYSYRRFEDVTDKFEIEFCCCYLFAGCDKYMYEGDITSDGCVVKLGLFTTGEDLRTEVIGFYKTDGQCKWGLEPLFKEIIIGNIRENPELLK